MNKDAIFLNEDNLDGNEVFCGVSPVDTHYPLHFHEFYEIELAIEGEGYDVLNGTKHEIQPDVIFLLHPTDYHELFATKPLKLINIAFTNTAVDNQIIRDFLEYDDGLVIKLTEHKLYEIKETAKLMVDIFNGKRSNKNQILIHLLNALLLLIIGSNHRNCITNDDSHIDVLKFININFAKNPSLQQLSEYCGYQRNYFCEFFKKNTGFTYKEYLTSVKIKHSKKLLKITDQSINSVALECGFNSASNFIREFNRKTGITPKQYRKLYLATTNK